MLGVLHDNPALGAPLPPIPDAAYPPEAVPLPEPEPKRGHPCRVCGQVLASPGALGGHMAAHRKRGELG